MSCYRFTPKAVADLDSIQDYIARDRPGLRSLAFGRYLLFYRQTAHGIEIVRVLHAARDLKHQFP